MPFLCRLKNKSDFPRYLRNFLIEFSEQFKGCAVLQIHVLRSDNAQEFKSAEVLKILEEEKILPQYSNPREQFQNGKAEKCIGDCWAMTRSSLILSNMTRRVLEDAWLHSAYVNGHLSAVANEGLNHQFT